MLSKELVAASTVPLVLSILGQSESYGYELIKRIHDLSDGKVEWSEGMLYPVLHWMENEGLIESEWRADSGRRRKYYSIRSEGQKALVAEKDQWTSVNSMLTKLWKPLPRLT